MTEVHQDQTFSIGSLVQWRDAIKSPLASLSIMCVVKECNKAARVFITYGVKPTTQNVCSRDKLTRVNLCMHHYNRLNLYELTKDTVFPRVIRCDTCSLPIQGMAYPISDARFPKTGLKLCSHLRGVNASVLINYTDLRIQSQESRVVEFTEIPLSGRYRKACVIQYVMNENDQAMLLGRLSRVRNLAQHISAVVIYSMNFIPESSADHHIIFIPLTLFRNDIPIRI